MCDITWPDMPQHIPDSRLTFLAWGERGRTDLRRRQSHWAGKPYKPEWMNDLEHIWGKDQDVSEEEKGQSCGKWTVQEFRKMSKISSFSRLIWTVVEEEVTLAKRFNWLSLSGLWIDSFSHEDTLNPELPSSMSWVKNEKTLFIFPFKYIWRADKDAFTQPESHIGFITDGEKKNPISSQHFLWVCVNE